MMREIADRAMALDWDHLSERARERLLLSLLANLSVGVAGADHTLVPRPPEGAGPYRLLAGGASSDRIGAAFWNGAAMHARTQDDFHPVGNLHAGTVIIPALMAVADETPVSGRDFLCALAAGYMVAVGLSRRYSVTTTPRGLRSTCIYAPFGASAAVARLRGAGVEEAASAIALTTCFAAGTTQSWVDGSDEWQVHAGNGAVAALTANRLAAAGVRGGEHALDGPAGFFRAVVGQALTREAVEEDFDASAAIEENVIKRYPVSGICQSVVLAALDLVPSAEAASDAIGSVRVEMNAFEHGYPGTLNRGPFRSFSDRLMSAAFCTASVLANGGFSFADFHADADGRRDRLVERIEVVTDPDLPLLSARIRVDFEDGRAPAISEVINSRDAVAIDWTSVDDWGAKLWVEAGGDRAAYAACREAVLQLPATERVFLPIAAKGGETRSPDRTSP